MPYTDQSVLIRAQNANQPMKRPVRIAALALAFLCLSFAAQAAERPNILLLMAEDMSLRVGAFGDDVAVTPNIDALAAQGVRYPNTFTTSGVCAPSRAAIITGQHQMAFGAQHMRTETRPEGPYRTVPPPQVKGFPEYLRAAGYYTFNAGLKLDVQFSGPLSGSGPFTIWDDDSATANWRNRPGNKPFFGYINFLVSHESGVFPPLGTEPVNELHRQTQVMRARFGFPAPARSVDPDAIAVPPYYPDTETVRADMARHYDNIGSMDVQVGAIMRQLREDGLLDDTIVIWTTDHGDGLPRAKRELYDSGIQVPMVIVWPDKWRPDDAEPGALDTRLISFVDLAPTILALAGASVPDHLHGRDIRDGAKRRYVYAARDRIDTVYDRQRAVRDTRFKYIRSWYPDQAGGHKLPYRDVVPMAREMRALYEADDLNADQRRWFEAPGPEQLYDLETDPFELTNLVDDPRYAEDLARLRTALDRWIAKTGDMSTVHENEMVDRFWPGGVQPVTPPPVLQKTNNSVTITNTAPGASIGYRIGGGPWRLYTGPVPLDPDDTIEAKAVRYGWAESPVATLETP